MEGRERERERVAARVGEKDGRTTEQKKRARVKRAGADVTPFGRGEARFTDDGVRQDRRETRGKGTKRKEGQRAAAAVQEESSEERRRVA